MEHKAIIRESGAVDLTSHIPGVMTTNFYPDIPDPVVSEKALSLDEFNALVEATTSHEIAFDHGADDFIITPKEDIAGIS